MLLKKKSNYCKRLVFFLQQPLPHWRVMFWCISNHLFHCNLFQVKLIVNLVGNSFKKWVKYKVIILTLDSQMGWCLLSCSKDSECENRGNLPSFKTQTSRFSSISPIGFQTNTPHLGVFVFSPTCKADDLRPPKRAVSTSLPDTETQLTVEHEWQQNQGSKVTNCFHVATQLLA